MELETNSKKLLKILKEAGFEEVSKKGSHAKLRKGDRTVILPHPKKDLPLGTVKEHLQAGRAAVASPCQESTIRSNPMHYFTAIVHQEGESAFGLTFPDLPGCHAAAENWDAIPAAATEALDLWFEDMPDVAPASLDAIRQRPDVIAALREGGTLLPVPYIPADTAMERVNISIERGLLRAIDETARKRGMTRSSFLAASARRDLVGAG